MTRINFGLSVMICVVALAAAGCKKKDIPPDLQEAGDETDQPPPEPVQKTADAAEQEDGKGAGEQGAGASDAAPQSPTAQAIDIHFTGKVGWAKMLDEISGTVYPVGFDHRFAVSVDIESVEEKDVPFQAGTTVIFAIHSPAKSFMTSGDLKSIAGCTYDFNLSASKSAEGRWSYILLMAKPAKK